MLKSAEPDYEVVGDSGTDRLVVGLNRRFGPLLFNAKGASGHPTGPVQVRCNVSVGRLEAGSRCAHTEEELTRR